MAILGGNQPWQNPCTPEEAMQAIAQIGDTVNEITNTVNELTVIVEGGAVDNFTFKDQSGGTAGFWDEKVLNEVAYGPFNASVYQTVYYEIDGSGDITLFTDKGVGAGDNFTVKLDSSGTAGFLDTKIHADSWEGTDTYNSSTHFVVLAAEAIVLGVPSDAVRWYSPYNIIKTSASDSAPNYLKDKFGSVTATAYNPSLHLPCYVNDTGSTLQLYVVIASIQSLIEDYVDLVVPGLIAIEVNTAISGLGAITVLIDADISAATWDNALSEITATVVALKYFVHDAAGVYGLAVAPAPLTINVDYKDFEDFLVDGRQYLGVAVLNTDDRYVLTSIFCQPVPIE
jgi:hypothetical protein